MTRKKGVDSAKDSQHGSNNGEFLPLSVSELETAKLALVKIVQREWFQDDIHNISKFGAVNRRSPILKLNPFLDANGILRVGGRLRHANLSYNAKHPILIPAQHRLTRLIIIHEHCRLFHAGAQLTLASIRQEFWPCSARNLVRHVINTCVICFRNSPKLSTTLMGDLPEARVKGGTRPFEACGIDYAGSVYYKEGQRKNSRSIKCFIAIFVCFTTKAVHLELSSDLTSDAFLNILKRFIARRGRPNHIYSDNGLNFVGAERELRELFNHKEAKQQIIDNMANEHIQWHFISPRAPHMGGLWEAAVKAVKFHLIRIAGEASLRHEELNTLLVQIEAILNSRPLTPLSADPNDFSVLTAGHFLIGCPLIAYPEPTITDLNINRLDRWQRVEQLRQQFWLRWTKEYLHVCQQRSKWNTITNPIQIGQLVILKEDNLPPLSWKLGRIKEVYPGQDGIIRTALIHTARSDYKRPITKLCVLPIN
ncbi:PREDICTED: uncharacterized protein LOC108760104 [Trachymyrmex cornetzi]|nr:PREDICTED: uncharacterized protein LOC108760104 [Trachymyrmex cornetzi]